MSNELLPVSEGKELKGLSDGLALEDSGSIDCY